MSGRKKKSNKSIPEKSLELAIAAPQVMWLRWWQMSTAGFNPSARDQEEFQRMWTEKVDAYSESWRAMSLETTKYQQKMVMSAMNHMLNPWAAMTGAMFLSQLNYAEKAGQKIVKKGLSPIHSRAVANAERLSKD